MAFIAGTLGNDTLAGTPDADLIDGGFFGVDAVSYATSSRPVIIDLGAQLTWDGVVNDRLLNIDDAIGSALDDTLIGNAGPNVLDGGDGGRDTLYGSDGSDTVSYAASSRGAIVDLSAQLMWDGVVNDRLSLIENAVGSRLDDTLIGDAGANVLDGGDGGRDMMYGSIGSDTVSYAASSRGAIIDLSAQLTWDGVVNDTLSSIENAIGSRLDDTLIGDAGDNVLDGGEGGRDTVYGSEGVDTVSYAASSRGVVIDLNTQLTWDGLVNDTLSSIENAIGSALDDDIIDRTGATTIRGGTGNDTVKYDNARAGVTVSLLAGMAFDGAATDLLDSVENVVGSRFDDTFAGKLSRGSIDGGEGSDTLTFAGDYLLGSGFAIDLTQQLAFQIFGVRAPSQPQPNYALRSIENGMGGIGDDSLLGSGAPNRLDGGAGNDVINGRAGADTLAGGPGDDTFVLMRGEADGDIIVDFVGVAGGGGDELILSGYGSTPNGASFVALDANRWAITSADGATRDIVTFANGAAIAAGDFSFQA